MPGESTSRTPLAYPRALHTLMLPQLSLAALGKGAASGPRQWPHSQAPGPQVCPAPKTRIPHSVFSLEDELSFKSEVMGGSWMGISVPTEIQTEEENIPFIPSR